MNGTAATLGTTAAAAEQLGNAIQIGPDHQLRVAAENPVTVCGGPS